MQAARPITVMSRQFQRRQDDQVVGDADVGGGALQWRERAGRRIRG